jgi:hypothetical protein
MTSWPAAKGMRCVNPSIATVSPSATAAAMASGSEQKRATSLLLRGVGARESRTRFGSCQSE